MARVCHRQVAASCIGLSLYCVLSLFVLSGCSLLPPGSSVDVPSMSEEDAAALVLTQRQGAEKYAEFAAQDRGDAAALTAAWLSKQPGVEDAAPTESGNVSVLYTCGLPASIIAHTDDLGSAGQTTTDSQPTANRRTSGAGTPDLRAGAAKTKSAVFLLPFAWEKGEPSGLRSLMYSLEVAGYAVQEPILNEDVTVDLLKSLGGYDFIYIVTHGVAHDSLGSVSSRQIAICTGERADAFAIHWRATTSVGIEIMSPAEGDFLAVNGRFFDDYHYSNSILVVMACESLKYTTLADAFLDNGAKAVLGWTDVSNSYFASVTTTLLAELATSPGRPLSEAYVTRTHLEIESPQPEICASLDGEYSLDGLFPWTYGPEGDTFSPDLKLAGDAVLVPSTPAWLYTAHREVGDALCRSSLEGTNVQNLGDLGGTLDGPEDVAVDPANGRLYVVGKDSGNVCRANLDGTSPEVLSGLQGLLNRPYAIALDLVHGKMYVSNEDERIIQANLDGTSPKDLGQMGGVLSSPVAVAVDTVHGKLYVACANGSCAVKPGWVLRANLDGSSPENLGTLGGAIIYPSGIALDAASGKMYVTDTVNQVVARANLDGTGSESFGDLGGKLHEPTRIALDLPSRKMYITNWSGSHWVTRANLDGTGSEELGEKDASLANQVGIALYREP